jgi:hypothetical protein
MTAPAVSKDEIEELERQNADCPRCPDEKCGLPMSTPSSKTERGRWYGPANARLWCPACGTGWYGTDGDVKRAEMAWAAYERLRDLGVM